MLTVTFVPAVFANARSGRAVATFGQRDMWDKLRLLGSQSYVTNVLQAAQVMSGLTVADLVEVVTDLVLRHETLRTRYDLDDSGLLWQWLTVDGEIPVELWDVAESDDSADASDAAEAMLEATEFDLREMWPIRVLVGTLAEQPKVIMLLMSHLAADMLSARIIRHDLVGLLTAKSLGQPPPELPARRQPLDQAAFEASAAGRRLARRGLDSWQRRLEGAPPTMFPATAGRSTPSRFVDATLTSRAVALAVQMLSDRYRATTAVVLMAAQAVILAQQAGLDHCALWLSVGNRVSSDLAMATGSIRQHSLAVIDVSEASFADVLRRSWAAWFQAQRTGMYDPGEIKALRRRIELDRGIALDLTCHFNDIRVADSRPVGPVSADKITAAAPNSSYRCRPHGPHYIKYVIQVEDSPREGGADGAAAPIVLRCYADTLIVPAGRVRELLYGIERLLIWQAVGEAARSLNPADITTATGVAPPARPTGWFRSEHGIAELRAVADLLRTAAADACPQLAGHSGLGVAVRPEPGPDGRAWLTGYLAVPPGISPPSPAELHQCCVSRLTGMASGRDITARPASFDWLTAIAPQHYVVCVADQRYGAELWLAPVIAAGSGRPAPSA